MRYNRILLVLSCCLLILASLPALAATQNAVVYGTVYDSGGNPLPGVTVSLDNSALGFSRTTTTGSDGSYNFAEVPPAEGYSITALKEGRKIDIRSGIVVNVGDERVIFPPLKEQPLSASAAEPTARKAEGAAVTSETVATNISGVISGEQLRTLPLYNRNFLALGGLTPNVHDLSANNELAGASFSVNGQRGSSNNFLLDGADNVASTTNQAVPFQVNDAIQEFRVISANAPAEYGRGAGGVVNVVTRRGSNAFHGSAFGYFANDALNSNNPLSVYTGSGFSQAAAFAGSTSAPGSEVPLTYNSYVAQARATGFCTDGSTPGPAGVTPAPSSCTPMFDPSAIASSRDSRTQPFDSRQFGVNLGGPIVKDKLFAFGSYEATLINNPTPVFERVPLPWDTTYSPFGAGSNPQFSSSDPNWSLAKNLLSLYPAANVVAVPNALGFFQGNAPNWTNVHNFLFRTDWIKSEKTSVSLRYALQKLSQLHDDTLPQQNNYPGNGAFRDVLNHNFALTWTHSLSARTINEMRVGFSRFALGETPQDSGFDPQSVGLDMASMPMFQTSGIDPQLSGAIPNTTGAQMGWTNWYASPPGTIAPTLDWRFPFARLGAPLGAPLSRQDQAIFGSDSVSLSMGKHNFKLGAEIRHQLNVLSNGSYNRGFILSDNIGEFTHDAESCNGPAAIFNCTNNAFLRPSYSFAEHGSPVYRGDFHNTVLAGFAQDTWRVGSRVTISYGLRYEYWTLPWEDHNSLWNYSPDAIGLVKPGTTSVYDPYNNICNSSTLTLYPWRSVPNVWVPSLPAIWNCHAPTATGLRQAYHAFAPRVGLAWDLFGTGKTVLRVGGGVFDDQRPVSDIAQLMYNRPLTAANGSFGQFNDVENLGVLCPQCGLGNTMLNSSVQSLSTLNPAFPNSFFSSVTLPQAVYARDIHHTSMPYSAQFDLTLQQQLSSHAALEVGYVGSRGQNLPVIFNPSQIEELFYANLGPSPHGVFDFSPIFTMTNQGESQYHSLMTRLRVADWHGLRMDAAYSWSRSMDNASSTSFASVPMSFTDVAYGEFLTTYDLSAACVYGLGGFCSVVPSSFPNINFGGSAVTTTGASAPLVTPYLLPQSQSNFLSNDRGLSDFDARHRFVLDYAWEIPTEQWHWPNWANHWSVSGIFTAQSGQPFTIFSGPVLGEFNVRASATGPVRMDFSNPNAAIDPTNLFSPFAVSPCNGSFYYGSNPAAPQECLGNTRRNQFIGPNYMNMDLAVHKGFQVGGEGRLLTFTTEFFNLFDRANYYNPVSTLTTDGTNFNPDFGKIKSAHGPRQIQFAIRYTW